MEKALLWGDVLLAVWPGLNREAGFLASLAVQCPPAVAESCPLSASGCGGSGWQIIIKNKANCFGLEKIG